MRFVRIATVLVVLTAIVVPTALALGFEDSDFPLPEATVGVAYNFQLKGRGECTPYTWTISAGALPPGIQLTTDGLFTGIPTQPGSWGFYVDLASSPNGCLGIVKHSQRPFTLNVIQKVTVTTASPLAQGTVGVPYSVQLTADGAGAYAWSVSAGTLPAGLTLSPTGLLAGTPTTATTSPATFTVLAKDALNSARSDTKTLSLEILAPLVATVGPPPAAEVGIAFQGLTPKATGGKSPYTWSIVGRPLPVGLTLDPTTGAIDGTPTGTGGKFALKLGVTDANKTTVTVDLPLIVSRPLSLVTVQIGRASCRERV